MPQVAFRLGAEPVFTYTVLVYLGLLTAVLLLAREGWRRGWGRLRVLEMLAWAVVPGVLGGRAAYVLETWLAVPGQVGHLAQPWGDGLSLPGGILAGAGGLAILAAWHGRSFGEFLGAAAPGAALAQAMGWLGAAAHGAQAGLAVVPRPWWAPVMRDLYGQALPRFPLQYLAAVLCLGAWALISWQLRSDWARVACFGLLTGWGICALLWGAEQRSVVWAGLSADQLGYALIGVLGAASALAVPRRRTMLRRAKSLP